MMRVRGRDLTTRFWPGPLTLVLLERKVGIESSVLDLSSRVPTILRQGMISRAQLD